MTYKCLDCGCVFESYEEWVEPHGEYMKGCPNCQGAFEEAEECEYCGEYHLHEDLYDGMCAGCLQQEINYESFFEYCEDNREDHYLDDFVMAYLLDMNPVSAISCEFHDLMVKHYKDRVEAAKANPDFCGFLNYCIQFTLDDDGSTGRAHFAAWLKRKEVK